MYPQRPTYYQPFFPQPQPPAAPPSLPHRPNHSSSMPPQRPSSMPQPQTITSQQVHPLQLAYDTSEAKCRSLQDQLNLNQKALQQLEHDLNEANRQYKLVQDQLAKSQLSLVNTKEELVLKQQSIQQLEQQFNESTKRYKQIQDQWTKTQQTMNASKEELGEAILELNRLSQQAEQLEKENLALKQHNDTLQHELSQSQSLNDELKEQKRQESILLEQTAANTIFNQELERLKEELATEKRLHSLAIQLNEELNSELNEEKDKNFSLEENIVRLHEQQALLMKKNLELNSSANAARRRSTLMSGGSGNGSSLNE